MILDTDLVRSRRRELELSQRQLAKQLGVSPMVVTALEDGRNHHALKLAFVARLADVLAVDVAQLFEFSPPRVVDSQSVSDLAASLGALLFDTSTFTPVEALAEATGHTLDDVTTALDSLESRLAAVGLSLQRRSGEVALRPTADLDPEERKRLLRRHQSRRGVRLTEARVLREVLDGNIDEARLSNPNLVALNRLRHAGLVTDDGVPGLVAEVKASLLLKGDPA